MYKVIWEGSVEKDLAKKDKIENFLAKDPTEYGKPLTGNLKGLWSYHFSKYRVIYQIRQLEP